ESRRQLLEQGYPHDAYVSERTVDSHVKRLRAKLVAVDPGLAAIDTVHGIGDRYREAEAGGGPPASRRGSRYGCWPWNCAWLSCPRTAWTSPPPRIARPA